MTVYHLPPRVPKDTHFVLTSNLHFAGKGSIGQLRWIDAYHVELVFGPLLEDSYVFDIYDTEPEVWLAVQPIKGPSCAINPSMTDPPCHCPLKSYSSINVNTCKKEPPYATTPTGTG
jgi:hypothetical protein